MTQHTDLPPIFQGISNKDSSNYATSTHVSEAQQQKVASVISDLSEKYPKWAMADVLKLKRLFNDANSITGEPRSALIKQELYPIAHDIKGQGTTFGYPLMTDVATALCNRIKLTDEVFSPTTMTFIRKHIDTLGYILAEKIVATGGEKGAQLMSDLAEDTELL